MRQCPASPCNFIQTSFFTEDSRIIRCWLGVPGICPGGVWQCTVKITTKQCMGRYIHKPGRIMVPDPACSQLAIGRPMSFWQPALPGAWPIFLPPGCCLFAYYSQILLLSLTRLQNQSCYLQLPMLKPRPAKTTGCYWINGYRNSTTNGSNQINHSTIFRYYWCAIRQTRDKSKEEVTTFLARETDAPAPLLGVHRPLPLGRQVVNSRRKIQLVTLLGLWVTARHPQLNPASNFALGAIHIPFQLFPAKPGLEILVASSLFGPMASGKAICDLSIQSSILGKRVGQT